MSTLKLHNKPLSIHLRPSSGAPAQEAADLPPGPDLSPDARGTMLRKNPRGPAPQGALLRTPDACGSLPQKKTRTPAPARQGRSRRGRPYPQNRDGSGKAGQAEGSLPRLAPEGRGFEQEITLLRSMINRLLSRRPLNHTYISRYMRLLIQAQTAQAKAPKELTDEQEVDSLIKKHFHKEVDDGSTSYYDLLPVRTARPGDKWWPWRQLVSIDERRRDGLIDEEDSTMMDAMKKAESSYYGLSDDDLSDDTDTFDDDPDEECEQWPDPDDPDQLSPDPDDDDYDPDDDDPNPEPSVISDSLPVIPDSDRESIPAPLPIPMPREESDAPIPGPTPSLPTHTLPSVVPAEGRACPCEGRGTHPPTLTQTGLNPPPCPPLDLPDVAPPPNPKPRIARGRPPP